MAKRTPAEQEQLLVATVQKMNVASQAIRLLGELHVDEAIPFLLENISFKDAGQPTDRWFWPYWLPCLGALIMLGQPAAEAALRTIEEASIVKSAMWGEEILARMLGPHAAAGYLQDRIDALKLQQKTSFPYSSDVPKTPIPVRIERLEVVRASIQANAGLWAGLRDILRPPFPGP
jgi:hypothetical protein